jgi:hypothetical protein
LQKFDNSSLNSKFPPGTRSMTRPQSRAAARATRSAADSSSPAAAGELESRSERAAGTPVPGSASGEPLEQEMDLLRSQLAEMKEEVQRLKSASATARARPTKSRAWMHDSSVSLAWEDSGISLGINMWVDTPAQKDQRMKRDALFETWLEKGLLSLSVFWSKQDMDCKLSMCKEAHEVLNWSVMEFDAKMVNYINRERKKVSIVLRPPFCLHVVHHFCIKVRHTYCFRIQLHIGDQESVEAGLPRGP